MLSHRVTYEKGEGQVCEQIASLEYKKWWEKHFDQGHMGDEERRGMAPSLCLVRGHGNTEGFGKVTMNQFSVVIFHAGSGGCRKRISERSK